MPSPDKARLRLAPSCARHRGCGHRIGGRYVIIEGGGGHGSQTGRQNRPDYRVEPRHRVGDRQGVCHRGLPDHAVGALGRAAAQGGSRIARQRRRSHGPCRRCQRSGRRNPPDRGHARRLWRYRHSGQQCGRGRGRRTYPRQHRRGLARRAGAQSDPDRAHDAPRFAAHERSPGSRGRQHRIDLGLVAAARDVGPIRCGQGGADLRHRALGTGIRAIRRPRKHDLPGLDTGRGQWLGPLPPRQSRAFRRLRPARLSDGPARRWRGGCGRDRVRRLAARPLDQWPQHSGGWSGTAARAARPPALFGLSAPPARHSQEMARPSNLLSRRQKSGGLRTPPLPRAVQDRSRSPGVSNPSQGRPLEVWLAPNRAQGMRAPA